MHHYLLKLSLSIIFTVLSFGCYATSTPVHEFQLENGLKLLVKEDHRAPIAIFSIWYKVGASNESGGISGISHALEHMMFKGTPNYGAGQFSKIFAKEGAELNAMTWYDFTAYYEKLTVDRLLMSFKLEADRMKHLTLAADEFAKEIKVVQEERGLVVDNNPQALTNERMHATAYIAHPYHHPIVGWMNDLENLKVEDLRKWYQTWYTPNNAVIVIVGDVDPKKMLALTKEYFGTIPRRDLPEVKPQRAPPSLGKREVNVKAPAKLPYLMLSFNVPSLKTSQKPWEIYSLEVAATILDGGRSARFSRKLIREKEIALNANVSYLPYSRFDTLFTIDGIPTEKNTIAQLKEALLNEVRLLQNERVSDEELERVKAQVIAENVYKKDSLFGQAMEMGLLESVGLTWQVSEEFVKNISAITAEQVQEVAKKYLTEERLTVATLTPLDIAGTTHKKNEEIKKNKESSNDL